MEISISAAAKEWGVTRQTIYNRIKDGELSSKKDDKGKRKIEHSEMVRVFGEPGQLKKTSKLERTKTSIEEELIFTLKEQLAIANRRIDQLEQTIKDKDDKILDLLRELQGDFSRFLEHKPESRPEVIALPQDETTPEPVKEVKTVKEPEQQKKKRGLIGRLIVAALD